MKRTVLAIFAALFVFVASAHADLETDQKSAYLNECRNVAMEMSALSDKVNDLHAKWVALGFTTGGPAEFTQADIDANATFNGYPIAKLQTLTSTWEAFDTWLQTGYINNIRGIMP
jgi:hypothetical protein